MKSPRNAPAKVLALVLAYIALGAFLIALGADVTSVVAVLVTCGAASYASLQRGSGSCGRFRRR